MYIYIYIYIYYIYIYIAMDGARRYTEMAFAAPGLVFSV